LLAKSNTLQAGLQRFAGAFRLFFVSLAAWRQSGVWVVDVEIMLTFFRSSLGFRKKQLLLSL
jgi:hypothetical protein